METEQTRMDKIVKLNTQLVDELREMNTKMDWMLKEMDRIHVNIQSSLPKINKR